MKTYFRKDIFAYSLSLWVFTCAKRLHVTYLNKSSLRRDSPENRKLMIYSCITKTNTNVKIFFFEKNLLCYTIFKLTALTFKIIDQRNTNNNERVIN